MTLWSDPAGRSGPVTGHGQVMQQLRAKTCGPPKLRRVQREQPLELRRGADGGRLEQCAVWVAQVDLQRQTFERLLEFGANGNLGMLQIFADADWRVQQSDARVTQLQAHAAPNASRDERRPPIPAVVVLGFAHEQTARVAVLQVARATVLPFEFAFALPRAGEANPQFVAAKAQAVADQGALRREHTRAVVIMVVHSVRTHTDQTSPWHPSQIPALTPPQSHHPTPLENAHPHAANTI